jgi:prepilin-type N-terminal cleavage/methylation domain-containing protein
MRRGRRGFSLVELAVVIALVAVFSMMAVPLFARVERRSRLRSAAREFMADLAKTRTTAASAGFPRRTGWSANDRITNTGLVVASATTYRLFIDRDNVTDGDEITLGTVRLPDGVVFTAPSTGHEIRFRRNGTAVGATVIVLFDQRVDASRRVVLSAVGLARLE